MTAAWLLTAVALAVAASIVTGPRFQRGVNRRVRARKARAARRMLRRSIGRVAR